MVFTFDLFYSTVVIFMCMKLLLWDKWKSNLKVGAFFSAWNFLVQESLCGKYHMLLLPVKSDCIINRTQGEDCFLYWFWCLHSSLKQSILSYTLLTQVPSNSIFLALCPKQIWICKHFCVNKLSSPAVRWKVTSNRYEEVDRECYKSLLIFWLPLAATPVESVF